MKPLEKFESLLGTGTYFVPCEWGTKKPLVTYTERPFEATKSDAYRAVLNLPQTNLAVYLGQASGGLCAIDFDTDEDLAAFLAVNPKLETTLRSRGSRGGMVWLRIEGEFPESCNPEHKHFEWRADKRLSTIYGRHPAGMDYALTVDAPPMTVKFADIVWPDGWQLPWVGAAARAEKEALAKEFGQPFYTNKDGRVTGINERYWAALFARENRVLYDPDEKTFYRYAADTGLWETITPESIREAISARILEVSRESQQFSLEIQITQTKLKAVIGALMGIVEKRGVFLTKQRFWALAGCKLHLPSSPGTFTVRVKVASAAVEPRSVKAALTTFPAGTLGTVKPESDKSVAVESPLPPDETGTLGTPISNPYAYRKNLSHMYKDLEEAVPIGPKAKTREPLSHVGEKLPYLTAGGTLVIPFDSPERYHWWKPDGERMSVAATLAEVRSRMSETKKEESYADDF